MKTLTLFPSQFINDITDIPDVSTFINGITQERSFSKGQGRDLPFEVPPSQKQIKRHQWVVFVFPSL